MRGMKEEYDICEYLNKCKKPLSFAYVCKECKSIMCAACKEGEHGSVCEGGQSADIVITFPEYIKQVHNQNKSLIQEEEKSQRTLAHSFRSINTRIEEKRSEMRLQQHKLDEKLRIYKCKIEEQKVRMKEIFEEDVSALYSQLKELTDEQVIVKEARAQIVEAENIWPKLNLSEKYSKAYEELSHCVDLQNILSKSISISDERQREEKSENVNRNVETEEQYLYKLNGWNQVLISNLAGIVCLDADLSRVFPFDTLTNYSHCLFNKHLFLCGGELIQRPESPGFSRNTFQIDCVPEYMDPETNYHLEKLGYMIKGRIHHALVPSKLNVFLLGGTFMHPNGKIQLLRECESFNPRTGEWMCDLPRMSSPKRSIMGCLFKDKLIYAFGGVGESNNFQGEVERLDLCKMIKWERLKVEGKGLLQGGMRVLYLEHTEDILLFGDSPSQQPSLCFSHLSLTIKPQCKEVHHRFWARPSLFSAGKLYVLSWSQWKGDLLNVYDVHSKEWSQQSLIH